MARAQKLDPTLTSHMFRYGHSEKLFRLGYTPYEVKEIGELAKFENAGIIREEKRVHSLAEEVC